MTFCTLTFAATSRLSLAALLLAAAPLATRAQQAGDLTGARPHASPPSTTTQTRAAADPGLTKLIHESVDLDRATADEIPDLFGRFIDAVRDQRRKWTEQDWTDASATLSRLNARYRTVHQDVSLEDRLRIRTWQGEFRTLQGARRVNQKLDEKNVNIK